MKQFLILQFFAVSIMAQVTLDVKVLPKGATVFLDGKEIGSAPVKGYSVKPGAHEIILEKNGYAPATHEVTVQDAKRLVADFIMNPMYTIKFQAKEKGFTFELNGEHTWRDEKIKLNLEAGAHRLRVYYLDELFDDQVIVADRNAEFIYTRYQPESGGD
jgi:hypothetical protein